MPKSVIFVDDEVNVIKGLRRMLWSERQNWRMAFVTSGPDALQKMKEDSYDLLITDMRMLGMDGAELMSRVAAQHPEVVRIVLSGQSDHSQVMRSVGLAHQFLSKPCEADLLKSIIQRNFDMQLFLQDETLRKIALQARVLPTLPALYSELSELIRDPNKGAADAAKIVTRDPGMVARILQLTNSAFFGFNRKIVSIEYAVKLLGIETVRHLVFAIEVFSQFDSINKSLAEEISEHSFHVGQLSKTIARTINPALAEEAFLAGVLHDVGRLMLLANFPGCARDNIESERDTYGCCHAAIGAYLLGTWGLPTGVVEAVAYHHEPERSKVKHFSPLVAVHVADNLVKDQEALGNEWLHSLNLDGHVSEWRALA